MVEKGKIKYFIELFNDMARKNLRKIFGENENLETYEPLQYKNRLSKSLTDTNARDFFWEILEKPKIDAELSEDEILKTEAIKHYLTTQRADNALGDNSIAAASRMTGIPIGQCYTLIRLAGWKKYKSKLIFSH